MKIKNQLLTCFATLLFLAEIAGQIPQAVWYKNFGGTATEIEGWDRSLCATTDGGYVWVGGTESGNGDVPENNSYSFSSVEFCDRFYSDFYVVKFNAAGDIEWANNYGGESGERCYAIKQTVDGGFILVGSSGSSDQDVSENNGSADVWVLKLNSSGAIVWEEAYGGSDFDVAYTVDQAQSGYIIGGVTTSDDGDFDDAAVDRFFVMKISGTGSIQWIQNTYPESPYSFSGYSIESTLDGGYINAASYDLIKFDSNGNIVWTNDTGNYASVVETPDNSFVSVGNNEIRKVNSDGTNQWNILYQPEQNLPYSADPYIFTSIINSQSGGYLVSGYFREVGYTNRSSSFILHVTDAGVVDWYVPVALMAAKFYSIVELQDGSIIAGGTMLGNLSQYSNASYEYSPDALVVRFEQPSLNAVLTNPADSEICAGQPLEINLEIPNELYAPFEIQLSNASGDFSNPVVLIITSDGAATCTIPPNTPEGDGYRVRFVSLATGQIGLDNGVNITIHGFNNPLFTERIGSVAGSATIAAHESANAFDQDAYTMSGTGTVSNANPSSGYENASGGANVFLGNTGSGTFLISGINTMGLDGLYLQFGWYHTLFSSMEVAVSTNGINYTNLSFSVNSSGWNDEIASGNIPQTPNLYLRFIRTGFISGDVRIDDILLIRNLSNFSISANGPTAFCGPGSVQLSVPTAASYLWNTGATTQTITANTTGDFFCVLGSANGCDIQTVPEHVHATEAIYYLDEDNDGFGQPFTGQNMCAPDATHKVLNANDCDDTNAAINPEGVELCDEVDNNCNNSVDEDFDIDQDGYTTCTGDCNDFDSNIHPGAYENNNGMDDNCNGTTDESTDVMNYRDLDGDGYGNPLQPYYTSTPEEGYAPNFLDCDDDNEFINPGMDEICDDSIDNNCDGIYQSCSSICLGDLDGNGAVNVSDLLLFTSAFGNVCWVNQ